MNGGVSRPDAVVEAFEAWVRAADPTAEPVRQREDLSRALLRAPPSYEPGSRSEYSNFGYALVGHMMETATGTPYETLMAERLFDPLRMERAGWGAPAGEGALWGHTDKGEPIPPGPAADNPAMLSPAGRAHMSLDDYAKYLQFVLAGAGGNSALLSKGGFDTLFAPFRGAEDYAMGWEVRDDSGPDVTTLAHTGSNTLWYAYVWVVPERDIGVYAVTNRGSAEPELDAVVWSLVLAELARRAEGPTGG
jgi:CubicO group peptidase (beta-lactamase class C family)